MPAKKIKYGICLFFVFTLLCLLLSIPCCAMGTGLVFDEISQDEISSIFERLHLERIDEPAIHTGFCCFDVNEDGGYALGFDTGNTDMILVYDTNGSYLYGFSFSNNGSLGIEWDDQNLILYTVRGNLAVWLDGNGTCLDMKIVQNSTQNNEYWNDEVWANVKKSGDVTFTAEHWLMNSELIHWGSYPRLVKTMPDGEEIVLFDRTGHLSSGGIFIIACGALFLCAFIIILIKYRRHASNRQQA